MRSIFVATCLLTGWTAAQAQVSTPNQTTPPQKTLPGQTRSATSPPQGNQALQPVTTGGSLLVGGADSCSVSDVIVGTGTFAFDNTNATTGAEGQNEAICNQVGAGTAIINDVWFRWTAPSSGLAVLETCNITSIDTKIAVYNGSGCPTSAAIACNDDNCSVGFQSNLNFAAVAGQQYTIQLGLYPGQSPPATPGAGTFTLNVFTAPANDSCATPSAIAGLGPHNFDNTVASTGAEGQGEANCLFFGSTTIDSDVWYTWTAPSTSTFSLNTCGQTGVDTKIAVYNGAGCPTGSAIACNDDACGSLQTNVCFNATAGQTYTIQLGTFPGAGGGTGTFTFAPAVASGPCDPLDDGSSENSVGLTAGGSMAWLNGFGAGAPSTTVTAISTTFGTPGFPGGTPPAGTPFQVAVWDDPNDDGNFTDGVLQAGSVTNATIAAGSIDTDVFQVVNIPATTVNGIFFVGVVLSHSSGQFPAPLDQSPGASLCGSSSGGSWVVGNTTGPLDMNNLNNNDVPPITIESAGLPGNWLLRVNCGPSSPGVGYCFGDGTNPTGCPCGNNGAPGHGCANSVDPDGALLTASGNAQVSNDTVVLIGSDMPNASVLYFQGTAQIRTVFGDGLRCAGGTVIRLGTKTNVAGTSQYPTGADQDVSVRGMVPAAGGTRNYQAWYRNAASFCTPFAFNLSNGLQIVWTP